MRSFVRRLYRSSFLRGLERRSVPYLLTRRGLSKRSAAFLFASLCLLQEATGQETPQLPTFEQLEAEGAIIGEIRIDNRNIFDLEDPRENNALYRLTNKLHTSA